MPVRFIGVGAYSLDVEVAVYVTTSDFDEFLAIQQELLLKMLQAVEHAGTALVVPLQESFDAYPARALRGRRRTEVRPCSTLEACATERLPQVQNGLAFD